ncbi:hypothetical protein OG250_15300 [Streptomyces sp. NBC_00487]|uniref:hypothetical protein n=1 Tax=unclassified Streptomyces TaxID=2593676 RepID=UPI002DD9216E|nr:MULTISPECIES: hypothetical protein [unclassified Streptomyces]WRY96110.1 hypothetical protein OG889_16015 [Streptomyces sp. NBC_00481]
MARLSAPQNPIARRALLAVTTAGVALGAGAGTAAAADGAAPVVDAMRTRPTSLGTVDPQAALQALTGTIGHVTGPVAGLKPNPLAGTGVDPLANGVGTQLADFKPLTSTALTGPVAQAPSIGSIPVLGQVVGSLR